LNNTDTIREASDQPEWLRRHK